MTVSSLCLSINCLCLSVYNQCQTDIIFTYVNIPYYNFSYLYISSIYRYTQLEFIVLYTFKSLFSHIHIIPKRDNTHPKCYIHVKLHQVLIKTNLRCFINVSEIQVMLSTIWVLLYLGPIVTGQYLYM